MGEGGGLEGEERKNGEGRIRQKDKESDGRRGGRGAEKVTAGRWIERY